MSVIAYAQQIVGVDIDACFWLRDPIRSGLHSFERMDDGRSYCDTAHCCYPWHIDGPADRRLTTIVLPDEQSLNLQTIVHELGHAFHYSIEFDVIPDPVSEYAATNSNESFAEAWTSFLIPGYADDPDEQTRSALESYGLKWWRYS